MGTTKQGPGKETTATSRADMAQRQLVDGKDESIELVRGLLSAEVASHLETRNRYAKERRVLIVAILAACGTNAWQLLG